MAKRDNAPDKQSRGYYETGMQIAYEMLMNQSAKDKQLMLPLRG